MRTGQRSDATARLLLIDSDSASARLTRDALSEAISDDAELRHFRSGREAAEELRAGPYDIILIDLKSLGDFGGSIEEAVRRLSKQAGSALVIALSDGASISLAVAAMQAGAHDYIAKPLSGGALSARILELARRHGKSRALKLDNPSHSKMTDFEGFIGASDQMQYVYEQIERIAPSSAPVFITGESGTGKELCAEGLHRRGARASGPFIAINCGAIPSELIEAELFGAMRGAFTGVVEDRRGAAEEADGGTLFLDEIGELDVTLQTRLLRFLQTGTVTRIGEAGVRPVDVRVICATNRDPMALIAARKFREDLFYRLHVLPIHLPPLRQRPADILPLARHFLSHYAAEEGKAEFHLAEETADLFVRREWPGNVRQLQNLVRRIVVMFDGGEVDARMVAAADIEARPAAHSSGQEPEAANSSVVLPMWRQEQSIIENAIESFGGNIARAAAALEISPSTIYRKRQSWAEMEAERQGAA